MEHVEFSRVIFSAFIGGLIGQFLNNWFTNHREKKKLLKQSLLAFYHPLASEIMEYFEATTAFRKGDLRSEVTPFDRRKKIIGFLGENLEYASEEIQQVYYRVKISKLYDDLKGTMDMENEHELMYLVLKEYSLFFKSNLFKTIIGNSKKGRKQRLNDRIYDALVFQIWMLLHETGNQNSDNAMSYKFMFDKQLLVKKYSLDSLEKIRSAHDIEAKVKFLRNLLDIIIQDDKHSKQRTIDFFFDSDQIWEDSREIYTMTNLFHHQTTLTVPERQRYRSYLLDEIYRQIHYGEEKSGQLTSPKELAPEALLALDYMKDKRLIALTYEDNSVIIKLTAEGIDEFEKFFLVR